MKDYPDIGKPNWPFLLLKKRKKKEKMKNPNTNIASFVRFTINIVFSSSV